MEAINVERNNAASSSAARRNLRPSYIESDEKMITQISGNRKYKGKGTASESPNGLTKESTFIAGRIKPANHKQPATHKPSSSMENKAKLTEKRLSIVQVVLFKRPRRSAIARTTKRGL